MTGQTHCLKCAAPINPADKAGLCPRCLMEMAFGTEGTSAEDTLETGTYGERPGTVVGRYKLLEEIGEGGFGVVYMAEQQAPVQRRVALKILKADVASKEAVARFEAERQALALMDHPNIAKVFDGGTLPGAQRRPYIVMELVRGVRLTKFCDGHRYTLRQRLELFVQVCQAVQHAHQKGVIHRDLKPSNILVTLNDGIPVPKVIDFGIAKALSPISKLTDKTLFTRFLQLLGTPAYMSPEQVEMTSVDVDTRSDVYSLGVVLYELLTGRTPFDAKDLAAAGLEAMCRTIREQMPAKPSKRLSTLREEERNTTAQQRGLESPKLIHQVRGDLDWIVMKCLEKDRARRYETANGLARDLERCLRREPVIARPPTTRYRLERFIQRHRAAVAAAAAMFMVLLASTAVSLHLAREARKAERESEQRAAEEKLAKAEAERQRSLLAEALNDLQLFHAESLFAEDRTPAALAYVANVLRKDPTNRIATALAVSALSQSALVQPILKPIPEENRLVDAQYSPDGSWLMTAESNRVHLRVAATGRPLFAPLEHPSRVLACAFIDGQRGLISVAGNKVYRWELPEARLVSTRILEDREGISFPEPHVTAHGAEGPDSSAEGEASDHDDDGGTPAHEIIRAALISPDGQWLALRLSTSVQLWNLQTGHPVPALPTHAGPILRVRFSPDSQWVVTASSDRTARVWRTRDGTPATEPLAHEERVEYASFSPDNTLILTAAHDGTARIWELRTGHMLIPPLRHGSCVIVAEFSPDGQRVVTASLDYSARIWDALTGRPLTQPLMHDAPLVSASFSSDGRIFATTCRNGVARLWDGYSGQSVAEPLHLDEAIRWARFAPDRRELLTVTFANELHLWDVHTAAQLPHTLLYSTLVHDAKYGANGNQLIASLHSGSAEVWRMEDHPHLERNLELRACVGRATLASHGRWAATSSADDVVLVWDLETGEQLAKLEHQGRPELAQFSPDGRWITTVLDDHSARVWEAATGRPVSEPMPHKAEVTDLAFSPDGQRLATASSDGHARIWEAATGDLVTPNLYHSSTVVSLQFSPDGMLLLTAAGDGAARLWNAATGRPVGLRLKHEEPLMYAEFSRDGTMIVTTSRDKTARIWNAETGRAISEPLSHEDWVFEAHFSPGGHRLLTVSRDRTVRLWDVQTGHQLILPIRNPQGFQKAEFSPDARRFLTLGKDNAICLWDVPEAASFSPDWLPDLVEAYGGRRLTSQRILEPTPYEDLERMRKRIQRDTTDDPFLQWAQWLLAPRASRTISSASPVTLDQHVQGLIEKNNQPNLRRAILLGPTNGLALARYADNVLPGATVTEPRALQEAAFFSQRATRFAPLNREVWSIWARVRERQDDLEGALEEVRRAKLNDPSNPCVWWVEATLLERNRQFAQAARSYHQSVELASLHADQHASLLEEARQRLTSLRQHLPEAPALETPAPLDEAGDWIQQSRTFEVAGDRSAALAALEEGLQQLPTHPALWLARGNLLMGDQRLEEALTSLTRGIELARDNDAPPSLLAQVLLSRCEVFKRLHRLAEAADDNLQARNIRPRDPQLGKEQLDLGSVYTSELSNFMWSILGVVSNRNHSAEASAKLSRELLQRTGVRFDLRGIINLYGRALDERLGITNRPVQVTDIPVDQTFTHFHMVLMGSYQVADGVPIATVLLHYEDGRTEEVPIIYGFDVRGDPDAVILSRGQLAWIRPVIVRPRPHDFRRIYQVTYVNPRPSARVTSMDIRSLRTWAALDVFAVTVEEATPDRAEYWLARSEEKTREGGWEASLSLLETGVSKLPGHAELHHALSGVLHQAGRYEEALQALAKATALTEEAGTNAVITQARLLYDRIQLLGAVGRRDEAAAENLAAWDIPARDPTLHPDSIDLTFVYNTNLFEMLTMQSPSVVRTLSETVHRQTDTVFDLRGAVTTESRRGQILPKTSRGEVKVTIPLHRKVLKLHILHGTMFHTTAGIRVGSYVLRYADGRTYEHPIVYGRDLRNWWWYNDPQGATGATLVRAGTKSDMGYRGPVRLYKIDLDNPYPDAEVDSVDFVSAQAPCAPFLVAMTALAGSSELVEYWRSKVRPMPDRQNVAELLQLTEEGLERFPGDSHLLQYRALALAQTNRLPEAVETLGRGIESAQEQAPARAERLTELRLLRGKFLQQLGRLDEAGRDVCLAKGYPVRDPQTPTNLLDLSLFYNGGFNRNWHGDEVGNNLADLPVGTHALSGSQGVQFDIRALIQADPDSPTFPATISGIPVGRPCQKIHFLHSASEAQAAKPGVEIGRYVMHLANGNQLVMPLVLGRDLDDWFEQPREIGKSFHVAWQGTNQKSRVRRTKIRLFLSTWTNPSPNISVESIDLIATSPAGHPFVVAITTEP